MTNINLSRNEIDNNRGVIILTKGDDEEYNIEVKIPKEKSDNTVDSIFVAFTGMAMRFIDDPAFIMECYNYVNNKIEEKKKLEDN